MRARVTGGGHTSHASITTIRFPDFCISSVVTSLAAIIHWARCTFSWVDSARDLPRKIAAGVD